MIVSISVHRAYKYVVLLCATTALCSAAHALERANLRTGFTYDCTRHESLDNTHVRLYLVNKAGEPDGFIDLIAESIASFETIPDPPKPAHTLTLTAGATTDIPTLIARAGAQRNIDEDLLYSVIHTESGFRANAVSPVGARGLMQLMPGTARTLGVDDSFKPDQNIAGGTAYLDQLLTRYHDDIKLALAAYNAGPQAVDRYHGIPPYRETRAYVARVINDFVHRKNALKKQEAPAQNQSGQTAKVMPIVQLAKPVEALR